MQWTIMNQPNRSAAEHLIKAWWASTIHAMENNLSLLLPDISHWATTQLLQLLLMLNSSLFLLFTSLRKALNAISSTTRFNDIVYPKRILLSIHLTHLLSSSYRHHAQHQFYLRKRVLHRLNPPSSSELQHQIEIIMINDSSTPSTMTVIAILWQSSSSIRKLKVKG